MRVQGCIVIVFTVATIMVILAMSHCVGRFANTEPSGRGPNPTPWPHHTPTPAAAVNHFLAPQREYEMGHYAEALSEYQNAFRETAKAPYLHVCAAISAGLCSGQYNTAERIGRAALKDLDWRDANGKWIPLYTIASLLAQKKLGEAAQLARQAKSEIPQDELAHQIILFVLQESTEQELIAKCNGNQNLRAQASVFIGYTFLGVDDKARASEAFGWPVKNVAPRYFEYFTSKAEYERLKRPLVLRNQDGDEAHGSPVTWSVKKLNSGESLTVRRAASATSPSIGSIPSEANNVVGVGPVVLNGATRWLPIRWEDLEGWVNVDFLEASQERKPKKRSSKSSQPGR